MRYWTTGDITQKLFFCLCMWGGSGGTVPQVLIHSTTITSSSLMPRTKRRLSTQRTRPCKRPRFVSTWQHKDVTCTLSRPTRRHSLSWLMAQEHGNPEVKNRVGQAHGKRLHARTVCQSCVFADVLTKLPVVTISGRRNLHSHACASVLNPLSTPCSTPRTAVSLLTHSMRGYQQATCNMFSFG